MRPALRKLSHALLTTSALAATLATAACGSTVNVAHRDALRDAEQAKKRGDLAGAANAYRAACQAQPNDKKSCQQGELFARQAVDQRLVAARPVCEPVDAAGKPGKPDVRRCLAELAPARALLPADPELVRLADVAGRAHADRCLAAPNTRPEEAVQLVRCMLSLRAEVGTAGYEKLFVNAAARAGAVFVDLAALGSTREHAGAQLVLWSAAACLDRSGEADRRVEQARRDFLAGAALPVEMSLGVSGPGNAGSSPVMTSICARTAQVLGPRAVCRAARASVGAEGPGAGVGNAALRAPLSLGVTVRIAAPEQRVDEERRSVRFQSGTNRFENPRFASARERVDRAEGSVREVEQDTADRDARCRAAEATHARAQACESCPERDAKEQACNEAEGAKNILARRQQELTDARAELAGTQAIIEEPVFEERTYVVRKHRFIARWVAELSLVGGATQQASGELVVTDEQHPGVDAAGLGEDPLSEPPRTWYEDGVAAAVAERAAQLASGELARRATARRSECVGDAPVWTGVWLSCWAESTLWGGTLPDGLELMVGAAHASDRFKPGGTPLPAPACVE